MSHGHRVVGREGFEPSKATPADLQSAPFGRSGTDPVHFVVSSPASFDERPPNEAVRAYRSELPSRHAKFRRRVRSGRTGSPQRGRSGPTGDRHPLRLQEHQLLDRPEGHGDHARHGERGPSRTPCAPCSRRSSSNAGCRCAASTTATCEEATQNTVRQVVTIKVGISVGQGARDQQADQGEGREGHVSSQTQGESIRVTARSATPCRP